MIQLKESKSKEDTGWTAKDQVKADEIRNSWMYGECGQLVECQWRALGKCNGLNWIGGHNGMLFLIQEKETYQDKIETGKKCFQECKQYCSH